MSYISEKELKNLQKKAKKWDKLADKISKYYCNSEGEYDEENPESKGDLGDIGLDAAMAFGWL
ncbi:MAG: hypothetical protein GF317_06485 [Candidatus Lokiarchaeota archaeon]|nr:hypothetical protein [Candidatus Lokiarchaeota archaeon]